MFLLPTKKRLLIVKGKNSTYTAQQPAWFFFIKLVHPWLNNFTVKKKLNWFNNVLSHNLHRKSSWIVYYHLVKNGTYQNPSSYTPINWGLFSSKHNFTSVDGHKLDFSWSWYGNHKFVGYSQSGGLFLQTWVPPSLYGKFAAWLEWYYQRYFKGKFPSSK